MVRLESGGNPLGAVDVAFPLLHGPYGEDGTVQGLLELAGLPYVGSGVLGSAVGMDKVMMKRAFVACGLATPRFVALREDGVTKADLDRCEDVLGYPCFVKPANLGSSVGVSKATDRAGLEEAVELALRFDEWLLVEESIAGREIEVAVLGDRPPEASLPGEIVPGADFYTYEDKYLDNSAELRAPTDLGSDRTAEVRRLAVAAFEACRCEAMARVDFFLEDPGRGFLVNEVNTIPGFTPISMYPRLWEVTGVPYPELLDRLVALALERHERRVGAGRAGPRNLEVDDRAGQRAGDALHHLDPGDDHLAELIDAVGLGVDDHVVGAGHIVGALDAVDLADLGGHLGGFADLGLDEHVRLDGHAPSSSGIEAS